MPAGSSPLTVEFKINLIAPAAGERFIASANVVRSGRTLTIVEADVSAESQGGYKNGRENARDPDLHRKYARPRRI